MLARDSLREEKKNCALVGQKTENGEKMREPVARLKNGNVAASTGLTLFFARAYPLPGLTFLGKHGEQRRCAGQLRDGEQLRENRWRRTGNGGLKTKSGAIVLVT